MPFTVLAAVTVALAAIIQLYCIRKAKNNINNLFPEYIAQKHRAAVIVALFIFNSYTVLFIVFWLRMTYSAGSFPISDDMSFNFLVVYPVFIIFLIGIQAGLFLLLFHSLKSILIPAWLNLVIKNRSLESKLLLAVVIFFIVFIPARIISKYEIMPQTKIEYKKQHQSGDAEEYRIRLASVNSRGFAK